MSSAVFVGRRALDLKPNSVCTILRSGESTTVHRKSSSPNSKSVGRSMNFDRARSKTCSYYTGSGYQQIKNGTTELTVDQDGTASVKSYTDTIEGVSMGIGKRNGGWDDPDTDSHEDEAKGKKKDGKQEESGDESGEIDSNRHYSDSEDGKDIVGSDDGSGSVAGDMIVDEEASQPEDKEKSMTPSNGISEAKMMDERMYSPM